VKTEIFYSVLVARGSLDRTGSLVSQVGVTRYRSGRGSGQKCRGESAQRAITKPRRRSRGINAAGEKKGLNHHRIDHRGGPRGRAYLCMHVESGRQRGGGEGEGRGGGYLNNKRPQHPRNGDFSCPLVVYPSEITFTLVIFRRAGQTISGG